MLVAGLVAMAPAASASSVRVLLDRRPDGAAAPLLVAIGRGLFQAEKLDVSVKTAGGAPEALSLLAKGEGDIAVADINALIRFRDTPGAPDLKAVFVIFNRAAYAVIARKSRGVAALTDLPGKVLGVADGDLAIHLWPALARQNGIDPKLVKMEKIGSAVRGPMLSAGQVDATTGMSYGTAIDVRDRGVPADDLMVFRFADYGIDSYGQAVIVDAKFAAEHRDIVAGFVRGVIAGIRLAAKDPAKAVDAVLSQMDDGTRDLELERMKSVLHDNILTDDVRRNGLGGLRRDRFDRAVQQIAADHPFKKTPALPDIFDDSFLPPPASRQTN